jgi:hypothetical protein
MTAEAASAPDSAARTEAQGPMPLWLIVAAALGFGFLLSLPRFLVVWRTGAFFDSDDAMRLVEVRNLIAGQAWFDLTIGRLDPPDGVFMHWSRVVDVPIAVLIKVFSLSLAPETAERAARLAFPLGLQALLYIGIARLAALLMGRAAIIPAVLLTLLSGIVFGQFQPGRIDHHAPQIVLLVFMVATAIAALDPKQAWSAFWTGLIATLSLSISIETLPFILATAGLLVLFWIVWGNDTGSMLVPFGLGLGLGLPASLLATVGPAHWLDSSCDAYSMAYFLPGLAGAAVSAALGFAATRLEHWPSRLLAAIAGASAVVAVFAAVRPVCLMDPFTGIDPLLRELWLDKVSEAMPLRRFFQREPYNAASFTLPVVLGLLFAGVAAISEEGLARRRWAFVAAMSLVGAALSAWMIRVIGFAGPLALFGGVWCIGKIAALFMRARWTRFAAASLLLALPFSTIGWAIALTHEDKKDVGESPATCLTPSAISALTTLEPGLIAAPIDAGSYILAFTRHSVLAAPYHRNNRGNRLMIDAFLAEPAAAQAILHGSAVDYVALCPGLGETKTLAEHNPKGLASALLGNEIPDFLEPVLPNSVEPNGPYYVFKVKPK